MMKSPTQATTDLYTSSDDDGSTDYDKTMQDKLANFMADANLDDDDVEVASVASDERPERRIPADLPENHLDHIVLATSNLKQGMEEFEKRTGLLPSLLGSLRGVGTKSARVALDQHRFIEIMGPDDKHSSEGMAPRLLELPNRALVPFHYAVRRPPSKVEQPSEWQRDDVVMVFADMEDYLDTNEVYKWDVTFLYGHEMGGTIPMFVNWRENKFHPTARLEPNGARLESVKVRLPKTTANVDKLLQGVPDLDVVSGKKGGATMSFVIDTPQHGKVTFKGDGTPSGVVMPGYGDDNHPSMGRY